MKRDCTRILVMMAGFLAAAVGDWLLAVSKNYSCWHLW